MNPSVPEGFGPSTILGNMLARLVLRNRKVNFWGLHQMKKNRIGFEQNPSVQKGVGPGTILGRILPGSAQRFGSLKCRAPCWPPKNRNLLRGSKGRRVEGSKGRRVEGCKGRRVEGRRVEGSRGRRVEGSKVSGSKD